MSTLPNYFFLSLGMTLQSCIYIVDLSFIIALFFYENLIYIYSIHAHYIYHDSSSWIFTQIGLSISSMGWGWADHVYIYTLTRSKIKMKRDRNVVRNCVEIQFNWTHSVCASDLFITICAFFLVKQRKDIIKPGEEVALSCNGNNCQKRLIFQTCRPIHTRNIYI